MPGLGRRTFAPGEVLTATNVMGYLQDQAVMNFAGTAARGSAIGTAISEGMVSYLADTNDVQVYDGTSWLGLGPKGRIAQIVHGSTSTAAGNATSTYVNTGLSATITPTSATSKIIVLVEQNGVFRNGTAHTFIGLRLLRDSTLLRQLETYALATLTPTLSEIGIGSIGGNYVETAGTTSAITYKTMFASANNVANVQVQFANSAVSSITLIEVTA
jgi:hypothetical protein